MPTISLVRATAILGATKRSLMGAAIAIAVAALAGCGGSEKEAAKQEVASGGVTSTELGVASILVGTSGGQAVYRNGIMVAPRMVLTSQRFSGGMEVRYGGASDAAVESISHPTARVRLIRLRNGFAGTAPYLPLDARPISALVGTGVTCYGYRRGYLETSSGAVQQQQGANGDIGTYFQSPATDLDDYDAGAPCVDATRTVVAILQQADSSNPWHAWLTPVTTVREWVADMVRLGDVKARGRAPFSLYLDYNGTRRCLDVADGSLANGAALNQFACHGGDNQIWYMDDHYTSGYTTLVSARSGKCIDVPGASRVAGTRLQQFTCHGSPNQEFQQNLWSSGSGLRLTLWTANALCLTATGGTTGGMPVIQDACSGGNNQRWYIFWNPSPTRHP